MALAHSRNGGPDAIYIGNAGDYCRTRRKRATRWDKRTDEGGTGNSTCEAELLSATVGSTATPKVTVGGVISSALVQSSSPVGSPSSTVSLALPAKTSSAVAAAKTTSKSWCDDRAWFDDEDECEAKCLPRACTEVIDHFSNAFPSFVCEC